MRKKKAAVALAGLLALSSIPVNASADTFSAKEFKAKLLSSEVKNHSFLTDGSAYSFSTEKNATELENAVYESEPNDTADRANNLPFSTYMIGTFNKNKDLDAYLLKITEKTSIVLSGAALDMDAAIELQFGIVDANGKFLTPYGSEVEDGVEYQGYDMEPGTYYVVAIDYKNLVNEDTYAVRVDLDPGIGEEDHDYTPPAAPTVNPVDDNDRVVTGKAEPGSTVNVAVGSKVINKAQADGSGTFSVSIPVQKGGTTLYVTATDAAHNASVTTYVKIIDKTAPAFIKVNPVDDNDRYITGRTEPYSTLTFKENGKVIGTTKAFGSGEFSFYTKPRKAGGTLQIFATDDSKNSSKTVTIKISDKTPPVLKVDTGKSTPTYITGATEKGASIVIKNGSKVLGKAKANSKGIFGIKIPAQKSGTVLDVSATDSTKNTSVVKLKLYIF